MAEQLPQLTQLARSDVGLGQQIGAQQVRKGARVDRVSLHPRRGDRPRLPRMSKMELDPLGLEQVGEPPPTKGGLQRNPRFSAQLREDRAQHLRLVRHPPREQLQTLFVESGNVRAPAMQVNADVDHDALLSDPELATPA